MSESIWHVGIIVRDLEATVEKYSNVLGITFREPMTADMSGFEEAPGRRTTSVRLAFSVEGPPYYELFEFSGTGLLAPGHPEGLHHLGVWTPDNEDTERQLNAAGVAITTRYVNFGCLLSLFTEPSDMEGVRFEFNSTQKQAELLQMVTSG
jgi:catechol 2,3-dioxygenase-like lactoylglutathione lyase family enzyme